MTKTLVWVEHEGGAVKDATLSAVTAARLAAVTAEHAASSANRLDGDGFATQAAKAAAWLATNLEMSSIFLPRRRTMRLMGGILSVLNCQCKRKSKNR